MIVIDTLSSLMLVVPSSVTSRRRRTELEAQNYRKKQKPEYDCTIGMAWLLWSVDNK